LADSSTNGDRRTRGSFELMLTLRKCNECPFAREFRVEETTGEMNASKVPLLATLFTLTLGSVSVYAKDEVVKLAECPEPVQAVVKHYQTQGTLEEIGLDKKKKSGGPAVYEAKFGLKDGRRMEIHISSDGKVLQMEEKRPKN